MTTTTAIDVDVGHSLTIDDLELDDVNVHDIWDVRESAVRNDDVWKRAHESYKSTKLHTGGIPHIIHQIWIGSRAPPCLWLDTWRHDFLSSFRSPPPDTTDSPSSWSYKLWDNNSVKSLKLQNEAIYKMETQPQCQADILRLEILYEYGGVYIDADVVSTGYDLRPVLKQAEQNGGFMCAYEPDTKDKPYSILGNSVLMATPKHPLVLMLMAYIKATYVHKRPRYGAEWVTGPLSYTKVLVHTGMQFHIPETRLFYPQFHYVPDPSAIDLKKIGEGKDGGVNSLCFQFGYTCSGLADWVKRNNKCRDAHGCGYCKEMEYDLGKLKMFENVDGNGNENENENKNVEKIIHQFHFAARGKEPATWTEPWKRFAERRGYEYRLWIWDSLKTEIGCFYGADRYKRGKLSMRDMDLLVCEVLHAYGGYYIPLSTTTAGTGTDEEIEVELNGASGGKFSGSRRWGSMRMCERGGMFKEIRARYYDDWDKDGKDNDTATGDAVMKAKEKEMATIKEMQGVHDWLSVETPFPSRSMFLGAGAIAVVWNCSDINDMTMTIRSLLAWAYECQVTLSLYPSERAMNESCKSSHDQHTRTLYVTDPTLLQADWGLRSELPGALYDLDAHEAGWEYCIVATEWNTGVNCVERYRLTSPFRAPAGLYGGVVCNSGLSIGMDEVMAQFDTGRVWVLCRKMAHSREEWLVREMVWKMERLCDRATQGQWGMKCLVHDVTQLEITGEDGGRVVRGRGVEEGRVVFEMEVCDKSQVKVRCWSRMCHAVEVEMAATVGGSVAEDEVVVKSLRTYAEGRVVHDLTDVSVTLAG